jgi:effector-binding domain-containing protein
MIEPPTIVRVEAKPAAVIHLVCKRDEIEQVMDPAHRELWSTLAAQRVEAAGTWFTHHGRRPSATFDFELGVPVKQPVAPSGRVKPGQLPAARVARTILRGPYEGLAKAWGELDAWVTAQGLSALPELWEVYLVGPEKDPDPAAWVTELNKPLVE